MSKTPVYFFSHGGPSIMYNVEHPVYAQLQTIGKEITTRVKPKAIVVFSAHWQADSADRIEVNSQERADLIYDFYNFPSHYYKEKFPNVGSKELAEQVITLLKSNGIAASPVSRGLDHGVWSCFKVGEHLLDYPSTIVLQRLEDSLAFDPETNPLNVPIVQVSLFGSEDPYQHYHLGKAVFALREQNVQIIVSGMAVHNLRERRLAAGSQKPMPYTVSFDEALKDAMTGSVNGREERMAQLLKRPDAKQAHPTFEHLIPAFVGAGAAGEDEAKRLWTLKEGGMSWAQFRFGEVTAS